MKDTNPDHYKVDGADFIKFMDDPQIKGFGDWMFANGFNMGELDAKMQNRTCEMDWKGLRWHDIVECPHDTPKNGLWFICKIKSSDNLTLVCGFENVTAERFDAWANVECPY